MTCKTPLEKCADPEGGLSRQGPVWLTRMQTRADFLAAGVDRNKIDRQHIAVLLELLRQLRREPQFTEPGKHPQQEIQSGQLKDYMAPKDVLFGDALLCLQ